MAQVGRPLDEWQARLVVDSFGIRPDGLWAARDIILLLARQNGKGDFAMAQELGALFLLREELVLHSAHEFKTSSEAFRRIVGVIEGNDWLRKRVKNIHRQRGDEGIELTPSAGGGRLRFVARSLGSGRGFTAGRLVFDEAYKLTISEYSAQTPTLATIPNPQITYTSSPPDEDTGPMPEDAMLPSVRARGRAGTGRVALYEWSPPPGHDPADRDLWYACNPALGIRISEEFLETQHEAFKAAGAVHKFSTEHLGAWPPEGDEQWRVIPATAWLATADALHPERGSAKPAFCIEMSPDREWVAICAAWWRPDGLRQVKVIDHRPGVGWLPERVAELKRHRPWAWLIARDSPAGSEVTWMEQRRIEVERIGAPDAVAGAGMLYDGVAGALPDRPGVPSPRTVRHAGQDQVDKAMAVAEKRPPEDKAWSFDRARPGAYLLKGFEGALWGLAKFGRQRVAPGAAPAGPGQPRNELVRPGNRLGI